MKYGSVALSLCAAALAFQSSASAGVYLNDQNISVALGAGMAAEPFANRTTAASLASVIDAPSAAASEVHTQSSHVWVSGGHLDLVFDLGTSYELETFHFWNYDGETYDVDDIDLTFFNASNTQVGSLLDIAPALGTSPSTAEDFALSVSNVRYVHATISGSNNQIDFQNIGFTAVPTPGAASVLALGSLAAFRRRRA